MAIYRGPGGPGDAVADAASEAALISALVTQAQTAETNAGNSASAAGVSATNAANSASTASTAATNAATSAVNAATSASAASTSATNAANSASAASTSETNAASSASAASSSASAAATSATNASNSASAASTSASNAASSASAAATSATNASNSASTASTAATNASNSATAAATSASNASTSATNAANSATAAASSASTASTAATNASNSASAAATSETNAATSATNAQAYELSANEWATKTSGPVAGGEYSAKYHAQASATSATNASNSASSAATSATNASSSASTASTAATNASTSASAAATSATNAAASESTASTAATNASNSASAASTSATNAATSATNAANSASAASTSETNAANSASSASTSATNASNSASSAATSATNAANSYDAFDDRYLGSKSSPPTLDNDGNALLTGALYWNTSSNQLFVWDGASWNQAAFSVSGSVTSVGMTVPTGLTVTGSPITTSGTLAVSYSSGYSIPTTTSQSNWDTAYSWGNHASAGYLTSAAIGTTVQGYDADLAAIATLTPTSDNFIVGNGTTWTLETPAQTRTSLGGTTVGQNLFTLVNPSAVTFPRFNADNSVSSLSASDFRTAIGAGTGNGTVTSVGGTGTVNGITLTGTVTSSGNLTLGGTLSGVSLSTQVTGTLPLGNGGTGQTTAQAAINSLAGAVTSGQYLRGNGTNVVMSAIQAADVPTLNQNTTGSAATLTTARTIQTNLASTLAASFNGSANITPGVTGTLPVANGGTGITSFGSGVATWLGTPSSANLAAAVTDETGSGALVFATTPVITGLREKSVAIAASDIDLSLGNYFTRTISGTTTFTVSNVATSGDVAAFILILTNGGSATVNWFSGVTWAGGTGPALTASGVDIIGFFTINGGTTWRGMLLAKDIK